MDSVNLNEAGIKPLQPDLDKIAAVKTTEELVSLGADLKQRA